MPFQSEPQTLFAYPSEAETISLDHTHYLGREAYDHFLDATGDEAGIVAIEVDAP
jgi:hypothetical protein